MQRHTVCIQRYPIKTKRDTVMFPQILCKGIYTYVYKICIYKYTHIYVCTHMCIHAHNVCSRDWEEVLSTKHFPWKHNGLNLILGTQSIKKSIFKDRKPCLCQADTKLLTQCWKFVVIFSPLNLDCHWHQFVQVLCMLP